ncbi:DUF4145 domain-containing protein [Photobacterium aquimaris]|uniref:DUF4145 domain-containing protein n=2 Tax=Photobacterium aquimaris TaxID=512643 RepID=A0A2T3IJR2_9GAMM|nr:MULTISPECIES: DUF4145 domain-containing protein [Photobacterium]OBU13666.1 DUF4145 domain-containing protein [Photobacterium aquimaris]PSU28554.1 DUF4145 domain-containing protein [Photobacterium aquimaris]PSW01044.1 DUF4145 domain-containing protein [Photobacterium aquimaris]
MMDIDQVIDKSRRLEDLLRQHYHAKGTDLTQLVHSCDDRFPDDMVNKLNQLVTMHQQIVTADASTSSSNDYQRFIDLCVECERELMPRSSRLVWGVAVVLLGGITLAALGFYFYHWQHITL